MCGGTSSRQDVTDELFQLLAVFLFYHIGGEGGLGTTPGADGKNFSSGECRTGGTAGLSGINDDETLPDYSSNLFCGSGGYSYECEDPEEVESAPRFAGVGGQDGNRSRGKVRGVAIFISHMMSSTTKTRGKLS